MSLRLRSGIRFWVISFNFLLFTILWGIVLLIWNFRVERQNSPSERAHTPFNLSNQPSNTNLLCLPPNPAATTAHLQENRLPQPPLHAPPREMPAAAIWGRVRCGDAEEETRVRASMMGCSSLGRPPRRVYDCGLAPRQQQQNHRDCAGGRRRVVMETMKIGGWWFGAEDDWEGTESRRENGGNGGREERGRWGEGVRRMRDERELGEIMLVVKVWGEGRMRDEREGRTEFSWEEGEINFKCDVIYLSWFVRLYRYRGKDGKCKMNRWYGMILSSDIEIEQNWIRDPSHSFFKTYWGWILRN